MQAVRPPRAAEPPPRVEAVASLAPERGAAKRAIPAEATGTRGRRPARPRPAEPPEPAARPAAGEPPGEGRTRAGGATRGATTPARSTRGPPGRGGGRPAGA